MDVVFLDSVAGNWAYALYVNAINILVTSASIDEQLWLL